MSKLWHIRLLEYREAVIAEDIDEAVGLFKKHLEECVPDGHYIQAGEVHTLKDLPSERWMKQKPFNSQQLISETLRVNIELPHGPHLVAPLDYIDMLEKILENLEIFADIVSSGQEIWGPWMPTEPDGYMARHHLEYDGLIRFEHQIAGMLDASYSIEEILECIKNTN